MPNVPLPIDGPLGGYLRELIDEGVSYATDDGNPDPEAQDPEVFAQCQLVAFYTLRGDEANAIRTSNHLVGQLLISNCDWDQLPTPPRLYARAISVGNMDYDVYVVNRERVLAAKADL